MELKEKILIALKPKSASFGFNREEIESVASALANNFNTEEEATEEAIGKAIDNVLPILRLSQSQATRAIQKAKEEFSKGHPKNDDDDSKGKDEMPAWFKKYTEENDRRIAEMEKRNTKADRLTRLQEVVKDSGAFGARVMRDFSRLNLESEEDFATYLDDVKKDKEDYEREIGGSGSNDRPLGGSRKSQEEIDDNAFLHSLEVATNEQTK